VDAEVVVAVVVLVVVVVVVLLVLVVEFPAATLDLQFPAVAMVTTDFLPELTLPGDACAALPLRTRSGSGFDIPRFFRTSFWTTRTRSTKEREDEGDASREFQSPLGPATTSLRLPLEGIPVFGDVNGALSVEADEEGAEATAAGS